MELHQFFSLWPDAHGEAPEILKLYLRLRNNCTFAASPIIFLISWHSQIKDRAIKIFSTQAFANHTKFLITQLFGISLGVIAVYIFEESQNYTLFIGDKNLTGLKLLMGAGGTLVVLGALGLLTTVRLNRKLMLFVSNLALTNLFLNLPGFK